MNFDLSDGTLGTIGAGVTSGSAFIEAVGNDGWYRIGFVANATLTGLGNFVPTLITSKTAAFAEVNTLSTNVEIWGAQFEASSSYPTSYIPTYGSASLRGADYNVLGSASSIIGQTEGTAYVEFNIDRTIDGTARIVTISNVRR